MNKQFESLKTRTKIPGTFLLLLAVLGLIPGLQTAMAQNYAIDWHKVSGGGSTSTGGYLFRQRHHRSAGCKWRDDRRQLFAHRRILESYFRRADSRVAGPDHHPFRQQRHRLVAGHGQLHVATEQQPRCNGGLGRQPVTRSPPPMAPTASPSRHPRAICFSA